MVPSRPDQPRYRTLLVDVHAGVATITLNRPDRRNAVGDGMRDELAEAYTRCDGDEQRARDRADRDPAGVLRGRRSGCGRGHLHRPGPGVQRRRGRGARVDAEQTRDRRGQRSCARPRADAGVAVRHPVLRRRRTYGVVQVRRGVVGDAFVHWVLPRLVGTSNAAEILLTGATFDGHRAVATRTGQPGARRRRGAARRAGGRARHRREHRAAVGGGQQAAALGFLRPRPRAVGARETEIHLRLMAHDDAREAMRAYLAGRVDGRPAGPRLKPVRPPRRPPPAAASTASAVVVGDTPAVRSSRTRGEGGGGRVGGGGLHAVVGGDADDVDGRRRRVRAASRPGGVSGLVAVHALEAA